MLTDHQIDHAFSLDDGVLAALPEISRHDDPQVSPQEYDCGCVAITRITDRDGRIRSEKPFEMRLARSCCSTTCQLHPRGRRLRRQHLQRGL